MGFVLQMYVRQTLKEQVKTNRVLIEKTNPQFNVWGDNLEPDTPPQFINFYLFHVLNPGNVEKGLEIPQLQQKGPFRYRKYFTHFHYSYENNDTLINTMKYEYYLYDPDNSTCPGPLCPNVHDNVTIINVPHTTVQSILSANSDWYTTLVYDYISTISNDSLFVTDTVNNLLWGHYEYNILKFLNRTILPGTPIKAPLQANDSSMEDKEILYRYDDQYETGVDDISKVGLYTKFRGQKELSYWGSAAANKIRGTDGSINRPFIDNLDPLIMFIDTLFRSVDMTFEKVDVIKGITMNRYIFNKYNFANVSVDPAHNLYAPSGLINITKPMNMTPVFVSKPFFMDADPYYTSMINFTNGVANSTLHETFIDVEPTTGFTLNVKKKRVQINTLARNTIIKYPKLKNTFFPVYWFDIYGGIGDPQAAQFKKTVGFAINLIYYAPIVGSIAGSVFAIIGVVILITTCSNKRKDYTELSNNIDDGQTINS